MVSEVAVDVLFSEHREKRGEERSHEIGGAAAISGGGGALDFVVEGNVHGVGGACIWFVSGSNFATIDDESD